MARREVEVVVKGPGETILGLVDRSGRMLLLRRLVVSGDSRVHATTNLPLVLQTHDGMAEVVPVAVRHSPRQALTFDGREAAAFTRQRSKEVGASLPAVRRSSREATSASDPHALRLPSAAERPIPIHPGKRARRRAR